MKYRLHHKQKALLNANFAVIFLAACAEGGSIIRRTADDTRDDSSGPAGTPGDSLALSNTSGTIDEGTIDASRTLADISIVGTDYRLSINQTDLRFALDGNQLIILEGAVFDYENGDTVITIEVVAEKEGAVALRQAFTLTIQNTLPQFTSAHNIDGVLVSEASTYVYQPTHNDRENLTYSLSDNPDVAGDDAGYFTIDTATGELRFAQGHTPDPAVKSAYSVLITARSTIDGLPFETTQIFSINALLYPVPQARQHQGTDGDDTLVATAGNDRLVGLAGNDILVASRGYNSLEGGEGDDVINLQQATNANIVYRLESSKSDNTVSFTDGSDTIHDFVLSGSNADKLLFVDKNNEGMSMRDALASKDITVGFTKSGADFTGFTLASDGETLTVNLHSGSYLTGSTATALQTAIDNASISDITALLDNILGETVFDITTDTTPSGIDVSIL